MADLVVKTSDFTGKILADTEYVGVTVREYPRLSTAVRLDASKTDLQALDMSTEFVFLDIELPTGLKCVAVERATFDAMFVGDAKAVLENAGRHGGVAGKVRLASPSSKARRDPTELAKVRDWCRANGWPNLSPRGRIPADAEQAWRVAQLE